MPVDEQLKKIVLFLPSHTHVSTYLPTYLPTYLTIHSSMHLFFRPVAFASSHFSLSSLFPFSLSPYPFSHLICFRWFHFSLYFSCSFCHHRYLFSKYFFPSLTIFGTSHLSPRSHVICSFLKPFYSLLPFSFLSSFSSFFSSLPSLLSLFYSLFSSICTFYFLLSCFRVNQ